MTELPAYKSKANEEQKEENRQRYYEQFKLIKAQEVDKIPAQHTTIRCGCLKLVHWSQMYRCLYCGLWFCKKCAEQHFGYKTEYGTSHD